MNESEVVERPLALLAAVNFAELALKFAAKFEVEPTTKRGWYDHKSTIVVERPLNQFTLLKARVEDFREIDFGLRTILASNVGVTMCFGMAFDEKKDGGR